MVKFTVQDLLTMRAPLGRLSEKDLPSLIAFSFAKFMKRVDDIIRDFRQQRATLVGSMSSEEPQGPEDPLVPQEKQQEFQTALQGLLSTEHEFGFEPINIRLLGDIAMKPVDLTLLQGLITE